MINLFIVNFNGYGEGTGVNTYVKELVGGIIKNKSINLVLVEINRNAYSKTVTKNYEKINISLPKDPKTLNNLVVQQNYFEDVANILCEEMKDKSNILIHLNWVHKVSFASLIKRLINCKVVFTKHNITWRNYIYNDFNLFLKLNNSISRSKSNSKVKIAEEDMKFYNNVDHIICVAESGRRDMLYNYKFDSGKITLIYNGIKIKSDLQISKEKNESNLMNNKNEKIILYVGREEKTESLIYLIKAFRIASVKYSNLRLVIVGNVDKKKLMYEIYSNPELSITFTGRIKKAILQKIYLLSYIGVITSFNEQCSYIALEMINYDIPLITTNADGLNELVEDEITGLKIKLKYSDNKVFLSEKEIVRKLYSYLGDDCLRKNVAKNAKNLIRQQYSSESMLKKTFDLYNKVLTN